MSMAKGLILVIDPIFSPGKKKYHVPVIRELKKDDIYDVIFVVMRYTQLQSVMLNPICLRASSRACGCNESLCSEVPASPDGSHKAERARIGVLLIRAPSVLDLCSKNGPKRVRFCLL